MKHYLGKISLVKNGRGLYCLDTTMGCESGLSANPGGCYGECYAARRASIYGHDFGKTVRREFENAAHFQAVVEEVKRAEMPFIRVGSSGDPSEAWEHTVTTLEEVHASISRVQLDAFLDVAPKEIVLITRHWELLTDEQAKRLGAIGACVNTSVSAIDSELMMRRSLEQYERLKNYLRSVLRVVSFDFDRNDARGSEYAKKQDALFQNRETIDTVFRCSPKHELVTSGVIRIARVNFMGSVHWASQFDRKAYLGKCPTCPDACGLKYMGKK